MRCPHADCGTVFRYAPAANGPAQEDASDQVAPRGDGAEYDLMSNLLAEADGPTATERNPSAGGKPASSRSAEPELPRQGRSGSGARALRQPVAGHPLAQASERSKDKLIGGKGIRFNEPRTYVGVLIGFVILCVGYAGFWMFKHFFDQVNNSEKARADAKAKLVEDAETKRRQRTEEAIRKFTEKSQPVQTQASAAPAAPAPAATPPASAVNLSIEPESAQVGTFREGDPRQFLRIVLKITNQSKVADHKATWSGTGVKLTLRDSAFQTLPEVERQFEDKTLNGGEVIQQVVFFDRPPLGADLTLEVKIPDRLADQPHKIQIPATVIQRKP
jgi:hypothetical protein